MNKALSMNIILIHGSWHGAWCWHKVVPCLEAMGHTVYAPDLPGHGRNWRWMRGRITLAQMASSICALLDSLPGRSLLVAHSRHGIVAATVSQMRPNKLTGAVYLAAYMLKNGQRAVSFFAKDKDSFLTPHIHVNKIALTDRLDEAAYRQGLYADCSKADITLAKSLLNAGPLLPALTRLQLTDTCYGRVPRHYIELTQDQAVSLRLQRTLVQASPCASIHSIHASHSAYFSCPDTLADVIHTIALDR
jgi:pimeloyl-ACP methyl ester carboxylesterase